MKIRLIKQRGTPPLHRRDRLMRILKLGQKLAGLDQDPTTLNLILTPADTMARMNEQFLQHQGSTDVLTFDLREELVGEDLDDLCGGEIYVCPQVAMEFAKQFGTTPSYELVLYLIHGMLHLAGEDDLEEDARRSMRQAEKRVMDGIALHYSVEGLL